MHRTSLAKLLLTVPLASILIAAALVGLFGCSSTEKENALPDANINGGAERSFSEEELANHDGSSYFPDSFTFDELLEDYDLPVGHKTDAGYPAGAYIVQTEGEDALVPGSYYIPGSQEVMGKYPVFAPDPEEEGKYTLKYPLGYFGFSIAQFEEGDVVLFQPPSEGDVMTAFSGDLPPFATPYLSGIYRVGIDIPAGTYTITQEEQAAAGLIEAYDVKPAAIVWADLTYSDGSRINGVELARLAEGAETATLAVEDGQYLELFGCTATPMEA